MITFYATLDAYSVRSYIPPVPVLLPASSWARFGLRAPHLPAHLTDRAGDCGGFVATFRWHQYKYTPANYVRWLESWGPRWAATMDRCCEDELTGGQSGIVRLRQQWTTRMAWHTWRRWPAVPWCWVPTVQGWDVADYARHARELAPLVQEMAAAYGPASAFRVGVGTLCRRATTAQIHAIVQAVAAELPGVPLHLWGIKLGALQDRIALPPAVVSVDSAAWNGNQQIDRAAWEASGLSRRRYVFTVALPAYLAKIDRAQAQPKQGVLF